MCFFPVPQIFKAMATFCYGGVNRIIGDILFAVCLAIGHPKIGGKNERKNSTKLTLHIE